MRRYVASKRFTRCKRPGVDQQAGDELVLGKEYERHNVAVFRIVWLRSGDQSEWVFIGKGSGRPGLIAGRCLHREPVKGWLDGSDAPMTCMAADVVSAALLPGPAGAVLAPFIYFGSCPGARERGLGRGAKFLYGIVAFSAMLSPAMGNMGPAGDMPGQLEFMGGNRTGVISVPGG